MGSSKKARRRSRDAAPVGRGKFVSRRPVIVLAVLLVVSTAIAYSGVPRCDFTNYDDYDYITRNSHVQEGFTTDSIEWAFNIGYASNWHPLTWLSHMLDCQLYDLNPSGHHLTSLMLHIANMLLLFWALCRMTGAVWRSAFVAALFGLHPLHVESVAWVSERKDVLCALFCFLAILAYLRYCEKQTVCRYAAVAGAFAFALMAKPMAVTLPVVLLLLDYWPLSRFTEAEFAPPGKIPGGMRDRWRQLLLEKTPLFALSVASGVMTIIAQHRAGSISGLEAIPLGSRIINAAFAYVHYIILTLRPIGLAAHYPYMKDFPVWEVAGAALFLAGISFIAARTRKRYPYLLAGWAWYIVTLLPVIGLVQVGSQAFADRYTYIPLIGIFVAITWGICDIAGQLQRLQPARTLTAPAVVVCIVLAALTASQTRVWMDSYTLWKHTLAVAPNDWMAHYNLGSALEDLDRYEGAIRHYRAAVKIAPDLRDAHYNLANLLARRGDMDEAIAQYNEVIRIDPSDAEAHCSLAVSLCFKKHYAEALTHARLCDRYGGRLPDGFMEALASVTARTKP